MEIKKEELVHKFLVIGPCNNNTNVRFTFSNGANLTYKMDYLSIRSEYINININKNRQKLTLDLNELGWEDLIPYLMMFLEYIGGSFQYPLSRLLCLHFLNFSSFFVLKGPLSSVQNFIIEKYSFPSPLLTPTQK